MNVNHHQAKRDRSYFEWGDKKQIVRKGNGDIAMTETELVDFFGVTWRKKSLSCIPKKRTLVRKKFS